MENKYDIFSIVQNNELNQFILGEGKYSFRYPEDGYKLWRQLIEYYNDPSNPTDIKNRIEKNVIDLFDKPDIHAKVSSLTLSEKMNLRDIKNKIIKAVENNIFVSWKEYAQRELLITATYFQIPELEEFIAKTVIQNNMVSNFIQWSENRLKDNFVGQDDLWKIKILASYYNNSNPTIQDSIIKQVASSARKNIRIRNILNEFIKKYGKTYLGFSKNIENEK